MSQAKEGAHAFMPTSNDSLAVDNLSPSHPSSQSASPNRHSARSPNSLPNESAVLSPPSHYHSSDDLVSPTDMSEIPSRQQVSSASQLPSSLAVAAAPSESHPTSDQTFWNAQYRRALELHENERKLWNEEKQFLERQISWLKDELSKKRSDSGVSYFTSGGKENDKVFADAEVIRQSQEKLRTLSNASPLKEQTSTSGIPVTRTVQEVPMGSENLSWRRSSSSTTYPPSTTAGKRLSSITENEAVEQAPRRVSINNVSTTIAEPFAEEVLNDEVPLSPPTTTDIPTPPNAKIDAGRTPPIPRIPVDNTAEGNELHVGFELAASTLNGVDTDPELDSPKMLPTAPHNGQAPELSDLNRRLESVAADPEGNLPEAVRSASASPQPAAPPNDPNEPAHNNEVGGVKLRTRRSLNFGAPLGNMRMG